MGTAPGFPPIFVHLCMRELHRGKKEFWDALQGIMVFMGASGVPVLISCLGLGTLKAKWSYIKERSFSDAALLRGGKVLVGMHKFILLL